MTTAEIMEADARYVMNTYRRTPMAPVRGLGTTVWDAEGREYLDFLGGIAVNALGHCHPRVVEAICDQARKLIHCSNLYYIEPQVKLARLLAENSFGDKVFFCNSGAEAIEGAIKLARRCSSLVHGPGRYEVISARNSFHGRTLAALAATGQTRYHEGFEPLPAGFTHVPFNDLDALQEAVTARTCAVLLEPVQGEGGIHPADPAYLQGVARVCRHNGLLLIFDEIQCGLGRTGRMFAYQHYGVEPDIMVLAKALGGGMAIGAVVARREVAEAFTPGTHASTFGGNPLACAAALAVMDVILSEDLPGRAAATGRYFAEKLASLRARFPGVVAVRGLGLMLGLELSRPGQEVVGECLRRGLLVNCTAERVIRFLPPLTVTAQEVDRAVGILAEALAEAGGRV